MTLGRKAENRRFSSRETEKPVRLWVGYCGVLVSVVAWTGVDTASFNLMLRMSSSHGGRRQGSSYLALNSVVIAVAAALSGVLGGAVATWLGKDWKATLLGVPLTYHGVLFVISGALRVAAIPWLFLLHEPGSGTPTAVVQHVLTSAQSRLVDAVRHPVDTVRQFGRPSARRSEREDGEGTPPNG